MTERTSAAEIIAALRGNASTGMCRCPAHDDTTPSLSVAEGDSGVVVFKCHAGCSQEAVMDALHARGLWGQKKDAATPKSRRAQEHDTDEKAFERFRRAMSILRAAAREKAGPVAYLKHRGLTLVPENARLLSAAESARVTGWDRPAMVLPILDNAELLMGAHVTLLTRDGAKNARDEQGKSVRRSFGKVKGGMIKFGGLSYNPDKPLIVAEGAETALAAAELTGLPAIAAVSAVNLEAIVLPPCSEVIVAADNDPTGREAAEAAADRLAVPGRTVRLAVAPGHGKDWNDLLRSDADRDELRNALLLAEAVTPRAEVRSVGMEEFMLLQFPKRQFLLKPWLTTTGLAMLYADPGVGKTRLALSIGYAVASGVPLLGWAVEHAAPVLFVDGEMPGELLQRWLGELGPSLSEQDFQILSHSMLELQGRPMPDLGQQDGREFLDEIIERNRCELVILDSVSTLVRSGVENDVESWRAVQDWSLKHRLRGRAVLFLHHTSRSGKMRGTSLREVVIDTAIRLKKEEVEVEESAAWLTTVELAFTKARHFFGKDALPLLVRFGTGSGRIEWEGQVRSPAHADDVAELKQAGLSNKQIGERLGLTAERIGQIAKGLKVVKGLREETVK
jgi:putative DNA primase/helicase